MHIIGAFVAFLLLIVLAGLVWWAVQQLIALVPMTEPFITIVRIVMAFVVFAIVAWAIVTLLGMFGISVPFPAH